MARKFEVRRFVISSPSARSLLLTRRNYSGRSLSQGLRICLRGGTAKLWRHAFTRPQLCAFDGSNHFAPGRPLRLNLHDWLIADLRPVLREGGRGKHDRNKDAENPHGHFLFDLSPGRVRLQDIFSRLARLLTATTDRFNFTETR
jgi:hypothetical protein